MIFFFNRTPKGSKALLTALFTALFFLTATSSVSAYPLSVSLDNHNYVQEETMTIEGEVNSTENVIVSVDIYNSTGFLMNQSSANTSGTFAVDNKINDSYSPGDYYVHATAGENSLNTSFRVISERLKPRLHFLSDSDDFVAVNTSRNTTDTASTNYANLTELTEVSKSGTVHYGNASINSTQYYFVLVDKNSEGIYDTIYADDDRDFRLYNFTEDNSTYPMVEQTYGVGGAFKDYMIGEVDIREGDSIFLGKPVNSTTFSQEDNVSFVAMMKNDTQHIKNNEPIFVNLAGTTQNMTGTTSLQGYLLGNLSAPSTTGSYTIEVNGTPTASFSVENFRLTVRSTDLSGNAKSTFSPGSKAKIKIISKDQEGNPKDLDNYSAELVSPNGSVTSIQDKFERTSEGVYSYDIDLAGRSRGTYRVNVEGNIGGSTQTSQTGFSIRSLFFRVQTVNMEFVDRGEGAMVNTFAPKSNVTLLTFLWNKSKGKMGGPADESGLVPPGDCGNSIKSLKITGSNGLEYGVNYTAMNVSEMADKMAPSGVDPPESVGSQCGVVIWENNSWINNTGVYSAEIKMDTGNFVKTSRDSFGIQRMRARGIPTDSEGNTNRFNAPNKTLYIKIKATDLRDRSTIGAGNITAASIIEMQREFPTYEDVYNRSYLNSSFDSSTNLLEFRAPKSEGFYSMKFRFKANLSGTVEEGIGKARFLLKEYILYGRPTSRMFSPGQNITIQMNVVDVSQGSYMFGGAAEGIKPSCTGCTGMQFSVNEIWNEELMKKVDRDKYDLNITTGTITNESNSRTTLKILINKSNPLPTGWYSMKITGNKSGKTYSGHAGFEIRNFYVEVRSVSVVDGTYILGEMMKGGTHQPGSSILFALRGINVSDWNGFRLYDGEVEAISKWDRPISESKYRVDSSQKTVVRCYEGWDEETKSCKEMEGDEPNNNTYDTTVVEISGLNDTGDYRATLRGYKEDGKSGGSDIGSTHFDIATFQVNTMQDGVRYETIEEQTYSSKNNLTVNFTAWEFAEGGQGPPHNLSQDPCAEMSHIFSEEKEEDIRFDSSYYSVNRTESQMENYTEFETQLVNDTSVDFPYEPQGDIFEVVVVNATNTTQYLPQSQYQWVVDGTTYINFTLNNTYSSWNESNVNITYGHYYYEPNKCEVEIVLSKLPEGYIHAGFTIYDAKGARKEGNLRFRVKDMIAGIPRIEETWADSESTSQDLPVGQNRDKCRNEKRIGNEHCNGTNPGENPYCNATMCIKEDGSWDFWDTSKKTCEGTEIWTVVNSSHMAVKSYPSHGCAKPSCSNLNLSTGSIFDIQGESHLWEVLKVWNISANDEGHFKLKHANGKICGDKDGEPFTMTAPGNYSASGFYFTSSQSLIDDPYTFNLTKEQTQVSVYHNTTHLWWNDSTDMNFTGAQGPKAVGEVIQDPWGGRWKITKIYKRTVNLEGVNVLPESGAYVDSDLSKSGVFKMGRLEEGRFGGGVDLNGDGDMKDRVHFVLADNDTSKVYDTLLFNGTGRNFSDPISVHGNVTEKTFANGTLTLLNIGPRGETVKVYFTTKTGDWGELGDYKYGSNVTVPVIARTPGGNPISGANVSVTKLKSKGTVEELSNPITAQTNSQGVGEVEVNLSALGKDVGKYSFGVQIQNGSSVTTFEEWKWPSAKTVNFLKESKIGQGNYIREFKPLPVHVYNWNNYPYEESSEVSNTTYANYDPGGMSEGFEATYIATDNHVTLLSDEKDACNFDIEDANKNQTNVTYNPEKTPDHYFYMSASNISKVWVKKGDCNFTQAAGGKDYNVGDGINLTTKIGDSQRTYYLEVLYANASLHNDNREMVIGINGSDFNETAIKPVREDENKHYRIMALNISGTNYQVILAGASYDHYVCQVENTYGCAKKAWISTTGNFSVPGGDYSLETGYPVRIGENFTSNLYVADLGPEPHSGIKIGNFSKIDIEPGLGDVKTADDTTPLFNTITESSVGLNLDRNETDNQYRILTYDERYDGVNKTNEILVDDDLNISTGTVSVNGTELPLDQVGNETGMPERSGWQPTGTWSGNIQFGEVNRSKPRYTQPNWQIQLFNRTDMLLFNEFWQPPVDANLTLYTKISNFQRIPVQGVNITSISVEHFSPYGIQTLQKGTDYTLDKAINVTDKHGIGLIHINKIGGPWKEEGHYRVGYTIESDAGKETGERWFSAGGEE